MQELAFVAMLLSMLSWHDFAINDYFVPTILPYKLQDVNVHSEYFPTAWSPAFTSNQHILLFLPFESDHVNY